MKHTDAQRRLVLLTEGRLDPYGAKTAVGLLRYRPEDIACVLDSTQAGGDLQRLVGAGAGIPIVATLEEALALGPTGLVLGTVAPGARLPESWRLAIRTFLERGLTVIAGLHTFLADDPDFAEVAARTGGVIQDLRRPPADLDVAANRAHGLNNLRVLTVGTDCNLGKKITALELTRAARAAGWDAGFVATGQTGIAIDGRGIAIDAVVSDFIAGAAERLVLDGAGHDVLFVEGQGAITHPGFSGVTLGLLHGAAPQAMVLCHHPTRTHMRACATPVPVPAPATVIPLYEGLARVNFPSRVVAVSLNTFEMTEAEARVAVEKTEAELGLPTTDPIRFGVEPILRALAALREVSP